MKLALSRVKTHRRRPPLLWGRLPRRMPGAQSDGHTLLMAVSSNTVNAALYDNPSFNFARDIELVAGLNRSPLVVEVNSAVAINTLPEFISYAKVNPGRLSMASFGTGTISHAAGELFKMMAAVNTLHVPYRGSSPMLTDILAGQVQAAVDNLPASIGHIRVLSPASTRLASPETYTWTREPHCSRPVVKPKQGLSIKPFGLDMDVLLTTEATGGRHVCHRGVAQARRRPARPCPFQAGRVFVHHRGLLRGDRRG